jgi:hypothetical protein
MSAAEMSLRPGQLTWADVLERTELIGGMAEIHELTQTFRGPVAGMSIQENNQFVVELEYLEVRRGRQWMKLERPVPIEISSTEPPEDYGRGCIGFRVMYAGNVTLYPRGFRASVDRPSMMDRLFGLWGGRP